MKLAKWFTDKLKRIMEHNNYRTDWLTEDICEQNGKWTPCDLIIREYLNNSCGSAKGFLGITPASCMKCMDYIRENKATLVGLKYISQDGWNNSGITLWKNYNF